MGLRGCGWKGRTLASAFLAAVCAAQPSFAAGERAAGRLPVLEELRPQIDFWKRVFGEYSELDVAIHDREDVARVYKVLRLGWMLAKTPPEQIPERRRAIVLEEIEKTRATLLRLHRHRHEIDRLSPAERRIAALWAGDRNPRRFLEAADSKRIRAQSGLRERFAEGVRIAQRYLPFMERVFLLEGIPLEITRLPLVESGFNVEAYSRVGAAGLWQFIPAKGRQFLGIDDAVDERRDPFLSTIAAARFLKGNFEQLESWPVAITAYNHGRGGMLRAVDQLGTRDLTTIIERYDGRTFGFASKNFYSELIAAIEVERDAERYFGRPPLADPIRLDSFEMPAYVAFTDVVRAAQLPAERLAELNLALRPAVLRGELYVPKGYQLRLPDGAAPGFRKRFADLPRSALHRRQRATFSWHRVRSGETLSVIARRYGVSVARLKADNGLRNANHSRVGQRLKIHGSSGAVRRDGPTRSERFVTHSVRPGQTLSAIARRYGTSVATLRRHNRIADPDHLRAGARLRVPVR